MSRPVSCLVAALVLGPVATGAAQDAPATLARYQGAQARFVWTTEPGAVKKGTLVRGDGTSITFALPGEGEVTLPTPSVSRLEVYAGRKRHTWHGLVAGAAVGVALGFTSKVDAVRCKGSYTTACSRGEALATYGGAGALAGALVGSLIRTDRWTTVPLGALRTPVMSDARAGRIPLWLSLSFRF